MESKHKRWLMMGIGTASAVILVAALALRRGPEAPPAKKPKKVAKTAELEEPPQDWRDGPIVTVPQPKPDFKPATPKDLGKSLDQASIQSIIDNLRVASETDDDTTMRAMIEGLRRRGTAAKALVEREMAQLPSDSKAYFAMKQVLR